jgi:hypothetical protein
MLHSPKLVSPLAGTGQVPAEAHPVFHALPTPTLRVEGKPYRLIQTSLAAGGPLRLPRVLWSHSQKEPNRDIRPMG